MLWLLALPAGAAEVAGIPFPDHWDLSGQTLVLNGAGLREYGVLGIDVYAAALYLETRENDADKVLASPRPKVLVMKFLRDGAREDTHKAWDIYFAKNCVAPCVLPAADIQAFKNFIPATRKGESQIYFFFADRVEVRSGASVLGQVHGAEFSRLLLSTWIGAQPTTGELKAALLGGKY